MLRKSLLACGIASSAIYVGADLLAALRHPEYHSFTARAVSELMADGAPTERLVDPLFLLYGPLMIAFAVGVWRSTRTRRGHLTAGLLLAYAAIGLPGPILFEMNLRGSGGPERADLLHIALTGALVLLILAAVLVGAGIRGRAFRVYSHVTVGLMVVAGVLSSVAARGLGRGGETPWLGLLERINIGAFLLWVSILAVALLRLPAPAGPPRPPRPLPRGLPLPAR